MRVDGVIKRNQLLIKQRYEWMPPAVHVNAGRESLMSKKNYRGKQLDAWASVPRAFKVVVVAGLYDHGNYNMRQSYQL